MIIHFFLKEIKKIEIRYFYFEKKNHRMFYSPSFSNEFLEFNYSDNFLKFLEDLDFIRHPEPCLHYLIFIPKNYLIIKSLDGENFYFRKNGQIEWQKTTCFVNKKNWLTVNDYIAKFCCVDNINNKKVIIYK